METTTEDSSSEQAKQSVQMCRLCMVENHDMISILKRAHHDVNLAKKISDCFFIVVEPKDASKKICKSCFEEVEKHYEFHEKVLKANRKFKNSNNPGESRYGRQRERLCFLCCARFPSLEALAAHVKGNENDPKLQCNLCTLFEKSFRTKCGLRLHEMAHAGNPGWKKIYWNHCLSCSARFNNIQAYRNHINGNLDDEKLHCRVCNESHQTKCSLVIHELTHKRPFETECLSCGARFAQLMELRYHMKGLANDQELSCGTCNASFQTKCALAEHKMMHLETCQSIFPCAECGTTFKEEANLAEHVTLHTSAKPFKCEICGKLFKKKVDMDMHQKIHDKIVIHTDAKRYKCSLCEKAFKTTSARNMHMSIHTGTKALKCDMCDGSFNRGSEMRNHKILMHNL